MKKLLITAAVVGSFLFVGVGAALATLIDFTGSGGAHYNGNNYVFGSGVTVTAAASLGGFGGFTNTDFAVYQSAVGLGVVGEVDATVDGSNTNSLDEYLSLSFSQAVVLVDVTFESLDNNDKIDFYSGSTPTAASFSPIDPPSNTHPYTYTFTEGFPGSIFYFVGLDPNADFSVKNLNFRIPTTTIPSPAAVPEPATMFLFGTGLVGLAGAVRRRKKK